jgi:RNA polymerase sigma factor (sigma-70 family)
VRSWADMRDQGIDLATEPAAAAHGGDGALEFDAFFEQERTRLFQALCLVTRNRFEAEELAQDAFLAIYERWDRVREMDDPTGYLYRTAMNAFRSWHRRSALAAKRAIGLTRSDDSIEQLEEQDVVVRALAPLTARQRAAVVLIDLLGYTSDEAGGMLGVRSSTVRTHVERAHRDLRARLEDSHG